MKKIIILLIILFYISYAGKDIIGGAKKIYYKISDGSLKIDKEFFSSVKLTPLIFNETKKLKNKIKEMDKEISVIKSSEQEILLQLNFCRRFSQLLNEQVQTANYSYNILKILTEQSKYTDYLVTRTTDIGLNTEQEIKQQKHLSDSTIKNLNILMDKSSSLNNITDKLINNTEILSKKLPKNLPM